MRKLNSLIISSLITVLTLELLVNPMLSFATNTENQFPEAQTLYSGNAVFQKGLSYSAWSSDAFGNSESDESLRLLTETNTEWIALCFSWFQSNTTSYDIHADPNSSPSVESIKHAITTAHSLGLKVMLKPMVEAQEREEILSYPVWRGEIEPSNEWFKNYASFINFFADFAEQNEVELFCIGCEYKETTGEKLQWEQVIQGVRERFSGPLTYAADWTNFQEIEWWGSVDYVGIDAYFPLTLFNSDPTLEDLEAVWTNHADEIEIWLSTVNKPVIFTEIGYRSGDGTSMAPANYWSDMTVDLQEQADCYEAAFQTLWNRNWFYGFYWWTWIHDPTKGGLNDSSHTPQNKPTQNIIKTWYSKDVQTAIVDKTFTSTKNSKVNEMQKVGFHLKWEHDSSDVVDARVYVNGTEHVTNRTGWISFSVTSDVVGESSWSVTEVQHPNALRYVVAVENPIIIWDKLLVDVNVNSFSFGTSKVEVKVSQAYDGNPVTGATIIVNQKQCNENSPGVYTTTIDSWDPTQTITVQTETMNMSDETEITTIHTMNIILYVAIIVVAVATSIFMLRQRKHRNQG